MKQELYDEIRETNIDKDTKYTELCPVYHALDTYEILRKHMSENEALKLTEIICRNEWDKQKCKLLKCIDYDLEEIKHYI